MTAHAMDELDIAAIPLNARVAVLSGSQSAFESLARFVFDPQYRMAAAERIELIRAADQFMEPAQRRADRERAKLDRVQAIYIAGVLACFDPLDTPPPFKSSVLKEAYLDQQRFRRPPS
ncbi:MAG TPA: hypothetical protein VK961_04025 [Chthoniobacter sp.]|nr:hypothetical protein [Chthoniobacter sp.]